MLYLDPLISKTKAIFLHYDDTLFKTIEKLLSNKRDFFYSTEVWHVLFDSRDLGFQVLNNIIRVLSYGTMIPMFIKECERECDYVYTIDFEKNLFKVKGLDCNLEFDLDNLPSDEEFLNYFPKDED